MQEVEEAGSHFIVLGCSSHLPGAMFRRNPAKSLGKVHHRPCRRRRWIFLPSPHEIGALSAVDSLKVSCRVTETPNMADLSMLSCGQGSEEVAPPAPRPPDSVDEAVRVIRHSASLLASTYVSMPCSACHRGHTHLRHIGALLCRKAWRGSPPHRTMTMMMHLEK